MQIVFIGSPGVLDKDAIYTQLDQALVTDDELQQYYIKLRGCVPP